MLGIRPRGLPQLTTISLLKHSAVMASSLSLMGPRRTVASDEKASRAALRKAATGKRKCRADVVQRLQQPSVFSPTNLWLQWFLSEKAYPGLAGNSLHPAVRNGYS